MKDKLICVALVLAKQELCIIGRAAACVYGNKFGTVYLISLAVGDAHLYLAARKRGAVHLNGKVTSKVKGSLYKGFNIGKLCRAGVIQLDMRLSMLAANVLVKEELCGSQRLVVGTFYHSRSACSLKHGNLNAEYFALRVISAFLRDVFVSKCKIHLTNRRHATACKLVKLTLQHAERLAVNSSLV